MSKKKKKLTPRQRKIRLGFKIAWLVILVTLLLAFIAFYFKYGRTIFLLQDEAKQLVRESTVDTFRQNMTTTAYDSNKKLLTKFKSEKDSYYLYYEDIPQYVKQAMVSIEDKSFATHTGVDLKANIAAVLSLIKNNGQIKRGGSTITQQLSRNIFLNHKQTWERKVEEIFIAMELEKKYEKYQILEFYLNNIYFANGYYGIQAASKGYFNKDVNKLSLSQIAFLCSIPNNPTLYDPVEREENTLKRRNRILTQMYDDKKISKEDYDTAINETITLKKTKLERSNYVDTYVLHSAVEALMKEQGFEFKNKFSSTDAQKAYETEYKEAYNQCKQDVYTKGYKIYTSIDTTKQKELQESIDKGTKQFTTKSKDGIYELQSAGVCIDNKTGRVVAIVGGRSQDNAGYTLNRAYQSYRQPGSCIKPILDYTPAFQAGYSPSQIVNDKMIDNVHNSNDRYSGKITLRSAIEQSKNTVAYQVFKDIGADYALSFLYNMNFHRLAAGDYYPTASIGGFTNGVSPIEVASGYAAIENDGQYREPTCIVTIKSVDGTEVVSSKIDSKKVYDENAARTMTDVLKGVLTKGTGKGHALKNMTCAGKTGTTSKNKDAWFSGYTPYYTTTIWVGYDIPKQTSFLKGNRYPLSIWEDFMNTIHEGLEKKEFPGYTDSNKKKEDKDKGKEEEENNIEDSFDDDLNQDDEEYYNDDDPTKKPSDNKPGKTPEPTKNPGTTPGQTDQPVQPQQPIQPEQPQQPTQPPVVTDPPVVVTDPPVNNDAPVNNPNPANIDPGTNPDPNAPVVQP